MISIYREILSRTNLVLPLDFLNKRWRIVKKGNSYADIIYRMLRTAPRIREKESLLSVALIFLRGKGEYMSITVLRSEDYCTSNVQTRETGTAKESVCFSDVIREYEEKNRITPEKLKESDDWRNTSDKAWNRMLESIDKYIDSCRETSIKMAKLQQKAARRASLEASAGMKSIAASQASLAVAACGFFVGTTSETKESSMTADGSETDDETDWTRRLETDDQTVLRTAQMAQEAEASIMSRFEETFIFGDHDENILFWNSKLLCRL